MADAEGKRKDSERIVLQKTVSCGHFLKIAGAIRYSVAGADGGRQRRGRRRRRPPHLAAPAPPSASGAAIGFNHRRRRADEERCADGRAALGVRGGGGGIFSFPLQPPLQRRDPRTPRSR